MKILVSDDYCKGFIKADKNGEAFLSITNSEYHELIKSDIPLNIDYADLNQAMAGILLGNYTNKNIYSSF